jgi:hypothetical protein
MTNSAVDTVVGLGEFGGKLLDNRLTRPAKQEFVRACASRSAGRRLLNRYYRSLDAKARSRFWTRYAKIFRNHRKQVEGGTWEIDFADTPICLPLRPEWAWLDWDVAVSIVGHDIEVKQTYVALLNSSLSRPELFIDVGANYGTHSILAGC